MPSDLNFFIFPLIFFSSSRSFLELAEGCVGLRSGFPFNPEASIFNSLSIAFFLLPNCVLSDCDLTISSPAAFILFFKVRKIRSFSSSAKPAERAMLKCSSILVLTLFTFCPPGPPLREAIKTNSLSGILFFNSSGVTLPYFRKTIYCQQVEPVIHKIYSSGTGEIIRPSRTGNSLILFPQQDCHLQCSPYSESCFRRWVSRQGSPFRPYLPVVQF